MSKKRKKISTVEEIRSRHIESYSGEYYLSTVNQIDADMEHLIKVIDSLMASKKPKKKYFLVKCSYSNNSKFYQLVRAKTKESALEKVIVKYGGQGLSFELSEPID